MKRKEIANLGAGSKNNPFSEILLNGDRDILSKALSDSGYHNTDEDTDIDVKILFNDVEVSVVDFDTIVKSWWSRMENKIKENLDYKKTDEAHEERANELIKDKLDMLENMIQQVRSNFDVY